MEESKKGGARSNAGRKPTDDPKMPITVYIETSIVQKNGGRVELAQRIIDTVKSDFVINPIMERVAENNKPEKGRKIQGARDGVPRGTFSQPVSPEEMVRDTKEKIRQQKIDEVFDENRAKERIKELEKELANPPKNPVISMRIWEGVRFNELEKLKQQLKP